jgi:hypothetical protein
MQWARWIVLSAVGLLAGCHHPRQPAAAPPVNYSEYHAHPFSWFGVSRVLVLPLDNETTFSHASEEVRNALVTELQQLGCFEVVPAPPEVCTTLSRYARANGRFNELALIQMARDFRADVIILGTLSQFSPYTPVRMGLVLQVISPADGVVVASVDGVWDSANPWIAQRARDYYLQSCRRRDEPLTADLVLDSPRLYQRFVCAEAAHILVDEGHIPPRLAGNPGASGNASGAPGCPAPPATSAPAPALLPPPFEENSPAGKAGPDGAADPRSSSRSGSY